ncbi:hypothetical protein LTS15_002975 [Exophiala xenobiotica]|nr:hypothetical protein LTS15_002975 [Exophiala xenobiotica]
MASPPFYDNFSPPSSQERSDRENSSHKRRRLASDSTPPRLMTDPSRPSNIPLPPSFSGQPGYYIPVTDAFPSMPVDDSPWHEHAAIEYLMAGTGFAQDLRGMTTLPISYSSPTVPAGNETAPMHAYTNQPPPAQPPTIPHEMMRADMRLLHSDFFRQFPGMSEERLRELSGILPDGHRYHVAIDGSRGFSGAENHTTPRPSNASALSELVSSVLPHRRSASSTAPPTVPTKPSITLILSRAATESIEALDDHKKECPACQLEFETDDFMVVISCCGTAMHATCLSAWVNSQTYHKSRACMKCRRAIDARRPLNNVVAPVTDQNWDEGADLKAPESLKGDAKIELNVSARPERSAYRRMRGAAAYLSGYRSTRGPPGLPSDLTEESRSAIERAKHEHMLEMEALKNNVKAAYSERTKALDDEAAASRSFCDAQVDLIREASVDIEPLARRWEETRVARDNATERFRKLQRDLDYMHRAHLGRLNGLAEAAWMESARQQKEEEMARSMAASRQSSGSASAVTVSP